MKNKFKAHAPIISIVLSLLAVGYSFAANVVVIPLSADTPKGMVSAFNSEQCPTGWEKYTDAQGRFVVGLNDGGDLGYTRGIALTDNGYQSHNHEWSYWFAGSTYWRTYDIDGLVTTIMSWNDGMNSDGSGHYPLSIDTPSTSRYFFTSKRNHTPPYVQLLFCEKV